MTHEELEDVIPLYAIGTLERAERQAMEAHLLSGCAPCHTALKEYQSVAVMLPFGLNLTAPPRGLKARMMAARTMTVATEPVAQHTGKPSLEPGEWMNHLFPPETSSRAESLGWTMALAAVAILSGIAYLAWTAYNTRISEETVKLTQLQEQLTVSTSKLAAQQQLLNERERLLAETQEELRRHTAAMAELNDQLIQREAELDGVNAQLAQQNTRQRPMPQDELAALLRTPAIKAVTLTGTEMSRHASGTFFYDDRTKRAWFYALNLPANPNGTTYQLWAMYEKPSPVGVFKIGAGATSHIFAKPFPTFVSAKKFAVSLEPNGGSPEPTGPLYLLSQPLS
jgi:anti-sigma-K factor RskA/Tfp pilus assembly protein PilE